MPKITNKFENILNKYRIKDLPNVVEFLDSIGRRSQRTALAYSHALNYFNKFIEHSYKNKYNIQTILEPLNKNKINRCTLLNNFVRYLENDTINGHDLSVLSVKLYMAGVRSYLAMFDIEITPSQFKNKIKMRPIYHEYEQAINAKQIKKILEHCNNQRLKAYLLVLASSGMRAVEALALRECDINDGKGIDLVNISPTKVKVRKEYAKTHTGRAVYISDEAARHLKIWIDWKYRDRQAENKRLTNRIRNKDDLIFSNISAKDPFGLYFKLLTAFQKVLKNAGFTQRKEEGVQKRHKITFHSFRRFVKTTISYSGYRDYSERILGHYNGPYNNPVDDEFKDIYKELMPKLTFLDPEVIEAKGADIEAKLKESNQVIRQQHQQIEQLRERDQTNAEDIARMRSQLNELFGLVHLHLDNNKDKNNKVPLDPEQHEALFKKGYIDADHPMKRASAEEYNTVFSDFKQTLIDHGIPEEEAEEQMRHKRKEILGKQKVKN